MSQEDLKFYIANRIQNGATLLLNTLLDKRSLIQSTVVQKTCRNELIQVSSSALKNERWALTVFDSNGQMQSGLMTGSIFHALGNYNQCNSLGTSGPSNSGFRYCLAQINLASEAKQLSSLTGQPVSMFNPVFGRTAKYGFCAPVSCEPSDLNLLANNLLSFNHLPALKIQDIECHRSDAISDRFGFTLVTSLLLLTVCVSLWATFLDRPANRNIYCRSRLSESQQPTNRARFVKSFSLIRACQRLMVKRKVNQYGDDQVALDLSVLNGLRVVSVLWIVIIHSYNFSFDWLLYDNLNQVDSVYKSLWIQWIANGTFSVDVFFLISGLLAYIKLSPGKSYDADRNAEEEEEDERGRRRHKFIEIAIGTWNRTTNFSNVLSVSFRRYLRLMPAMMSVILISVFILPELGHGPCWASATRMFDLWCRKNWYWNLLMVHNFAKPEICLSHSWYVASDLQLFLVLQLLLLISCRKLTKRIIVLSMIVAQVLIASMIYTKELTSIPMLPIPGESAASSIIDYYRFVYIKPYYWLTSYLMGALLAMSLLRSTRASESRSRKVSTGVITFTLQLLLLPTIVGLIFFTWPYFSRLIEMSRLQSATFALFTRPLWSICVSGFLYLAIRRPKLLPVYETISVLRFIVIPLTRFARLGLSSFIWLPLSRLSYQVYLLHPIVIAAFYGSRTETFQFSHWILIYFTLGNIVITYILALIVFLFIESPINSLIEQSFPKK